MQAAAMQLPCIVTNINGCNEIIMNQKSGLIIPVKSADALLNAMQYFLHHKEEAKKMGLKSRAHIEKNFERRVVWEAILDEYQSLNN